MNDYEKLGAFYLGRTFDLATNQATQDLVLYDSKDMTTHAVCVGMTGSGKTGLCLGLLEEAAIDGIPIIAIDPKGDLGNLLLTFPELRPDDFRPWVDPAEATRKGLNVDQYAAQCAESWRKGLADWDQQPERIERLRNAAEVAIYTPGSSAGLPLTVLRSFNAPSPELIQQGEMFRERIASAVSGLLALLDVEADPISSREHILLSNIFDRAWRDGKNLDMANLIRSIQQPGFDKVGFLDLETFFPSKERFALAMLLNNLVASPNFAAWLEGEPLDIKSLLHSPQGKPRISIISIAHLSDAERMFFVTILLNEIVSWVRAQSGTSSLRAILYMDEVFGYFPPTANPPSKLPMLTLLKQARAFGLGVMLATQNPVDLDYKGLANAGTWFLGRLQTERDKARVLDGLEGASAAAGARFDRQTMSEILGRCGNRVFLMNNVHDDQPVVFQTRWTLSYLRGPLNREQVSSLMANLKASRPKSDSSASDAASPSAKQGGTSAPGGARPVLPPEVVESFLPVRGSKPKDAALLYRPALLGQGKVHFVEAKSAVDEWQEISRLQLLDESVPEDVWATEHSLDADPSETEKSPEEGALFAPLPSELNRAKSYKGWEGDLKNSLYRTAELSIFRCKDLGENSRPGESEREFRTRLTQTAREERDLAIEKLRQKYAPKLATVQEQVRKAEQRVEKEKTQAQQSTFSAALSFGTSLLGAFAGRKMVTATNISKAATAARAAGRVLEQRGDVSSANDNVEALQEKFALLEKEFKEECDALDASAAPDSLSVEQVALKPRKADIAVTRVALVWTPWWAGDGGTAEAF